VDSVSEESEIEVAEEFNELFGDPGVGDVDTVIEKTTNPYRKWLKTVNSTVEHPVLVPGFLNNRYQLAVKDKNNWVVCVTRSKQFAASGDPIVQENSFELYASRINEDDLRQSFIDYLISTHEGDPPPFPDVLEDLQNGNFDPYNIRLVQSYLGSVY
jgi:hypothetical protein